MLLPFYCLAILRKKWPKIRLDLFKQGISNREIKNCFFNLFYRKIEEQEYPMFHYKTFEGRLKIKDKSKEAN